MTKKSKIDHYTDKEALDFHINGKSGKIEVISSKSLTTKRDLSLAYSPGVAAPVKAISKNPDASYDYTSKGNLVAVISNGSAILGLGNLGSLASKPVMEGKAVLFKRFADIDSIDIEVDSSDTDEIVNTIKNIVLDDIAPEKINEELFNKYINKDDVPDPDLIVRTGGEYRLSNFLIWQSAYSEFYTSEVLWPDFTEVDFFDALKNYSSRNRKFGAD